MFAKLLKHEWNAAWKQLGIVSLGAMGVGILGTVLMRFLIHSLMEDNGDLLASVLGIMMVFLFLALAAYVIGSAIALYYRFYKNKFTDEGYLTFTLPARSWEIFLSSLVNILLWMAIVSIISTTAVGLIVLVGMSDILKMMAEEMQLYFGLQFWQEIFGLIDPRQVVSSLVSGLVSFVSGVTIVLSCITMGCTFAKKHKILASIGIYYGLSMIQGVLSSVITVGVSLTASADLAFQRVTLLEALIQVVLAVAGSLLSVYLMKKELNLP